MEAGGLDPSTFIFPNDIFYISSLPGLVPIPFVFCSFSLHVFGVFPGRFPRMVFKGKLEGDNIFFAMRFRIRFVI